MPPTALRSQNARLATSLGGSRNSLYLTRYFHVSRSKQVWNEALHLSHDIFQSVHTVSGLQWGLSLALTGALWRIAFLPCNYVAERNIKRAQLYAPLLASWRSEYRRQAIVKQQKGIIPPGPEAADKWWTEQHRRRSKVLRSQFGHRWWYNLLPLLHIPVWLVNMDVIRSMIGINGPRGNPFEIPMETSIVGEKLLWVPDIAYADPFYILPLAVWGLNICYFYLNIKDRTWRTREDIDKLPSPRERTFARVSRGITLMTGSAITMLGPFIIYNEIAAALCCYWAAGTAMLIIDKLALKRIFALKKKIEPAISLDARLKRRAPHYS